MGSLFDGIGGFPLAAIHNGIVPLWASEIESFPIRVTMERLPGMLHFGDITKLNGALLPPVDIICGGSPCQDLSVAGKRTGLSGERSGLFMEQIRIIKEMRDADLLRGRSGLHVRPRRVLLQQRRGLPACPGRNAPNWSTGLICSSKSSLGLAIFWGSHIGSSYLPLLASP